MVVRFWFLIAVLFGLSLFAQTHAIDNWKRAPELEEIPSADEQGIVLGSCVIKIPGTERSYNPSLVRWDDGYLLAVRQDVPYSAYPIDYSFISLWKLDGSFRIVEKGVRLKLLDEHSEDPRLFFVNDDLYLSYTHVKDASSDWKTDIGMAKLSQDTLEPLFVTRLCVPWPSKKEKNWVPFFVEDKDGETTLYFVYSFNPLKILRVIREEEGSTRLCYKGIHNPVLSQWEKRFGLIRGGTPAIRLSTGEYITFFHSSKGYGDYYLMGAILFEAEPFRLKKISPWPILFKGAYFPCQGCPKSKVLFPGGLVEEIDEEGREVFHVACGVNDAVVKIVTLDKQALLKSLVSVEEPVKNIPFMQKSVPALGYRPIQEE